MPETILVIGATGMLGKPVALKLASDGHNVKVLSRNQSKLESTFNSRNNISYHQGDIHNITSLQDAMKDCKGVHINLSGGELESYGTRQVIKAIQGLESNTIQRITLISGISTCEENCWYEGTKAKLDAEMQLIQSGINYTIFRCTMFLETLPKWEYIIGEQPTKWHWLAASDYARMVSNSYSCNSTINKILFICGPGPSRTLKEAIDIFIPICTPGRSLPTIYLEDLKSHDLEEKTIDKFMWLSKIHELGDPSEANELLGTPSMSLEQWCRDYANGTK